MILLIDGDELLHTTLAAIEQEEDWGNDVWILSTNLEVARETILQRLRNYEDKLNATNTIVAFTGYGAQWRKELEPTYKSSRRATRKPMGFAALKEEAIAGDLFDGPTVVIRGTLEADDVIGILATKPQNIGRTIIVSQDKDFLGVPGKLYRTNVEEPSIIDVSLEQARQWHMLQTLAGDTADGYKGCPGIGEVIAKDLLSKRLKFVPVARYLTRGPNKGDEVIEWERIASDSPWATVVSCYDKAGLTEADALLQARLARILQWDDWDSENEKVRLWTPNEYSYPSST